jgi:hypothetical protein
MVINRGPTQIDADINGQATCPTKGFHALRANNICSLMRQHPVVVRVNLRESAVKNKFTPITITNCEK